MKIAPLKTGFNRFHVCKILSVSAANSSAIEGESTRCQIVRHRDKTGNRDRSLVVPVGVEHIGYVGGSEIFALGSRQDLR